MIGDGDKLDGNGWGRDKYPSPCSSLASTV